MRGREGTPDKAGRHRAGMIDKGWRLCSIRGQAGRGVIEDRHVSREEARRTTERQRTCCLQLRLSVSCSFLLSFCRFFCPLRLATYFSLPSSPRRGAYARCGAVESRWVEGRRSSREKHRPPSVLTPKRCVLSERILASSSPVRGCFLPRWADARGSTAKD